MSEGYPRRLRVSTRLVFNNPRIDLPDTTHQGAELLNGFLVFAIQRTTDNANNVVIMHDNPTAVLNQLSQELGNVEKVRRTNGQEELQMSTGAWVKVIRWTHHGRGFVANLLILPVGLNNEQREDLLPILATTNGEILGYL